MGILTKSDQYLCIDKLQIDKATHFINAEVKVYNSQEDRAAQVAPVAVFSHTKVLTPLFWEGYFGNLLNNTNPYQLAYNYIKTFDKAFTNGTDV